MATPEFKLTEKAAGILQRFFSVGLDRIVTILRDQDVSLSAFDESVKREIESQIAITIAEMNSETVRIAPQLIEATYINTFNSESEKSLTGSAFFQVHRGRIEVLSNEIARSITDGVAEVGRWVQDGLREAQLQSSLEANIEGLGFREQRQRLSDLMNVENISMPRGFRGNFKSYVDMVVRTNLAEANRQARVNATLERGISLVQIEGYGSVTTCRPFEGAIISLVANVEGVPTFDQLKRLKKSHIFKPNCRHERLIPVTPERFSKAQITDGIEKAKSAVRQFS